MLNLNPSQIAVAHARAPRTLAVSGAGTGKTAACCAWVAGLVEVGVSPSSILMLTFTRKAGEEMRKRANALIEKIPGRDPNSKLAVGNYHMIASAMLRKDPKGFGLQEGNFTILDAEDAERLWKSAIKAAGVEKPSGPFKPSVIAGMVSKALNWCKDPAKQLPNRFETKEDGEIAVKAYRNYVSLKESANCVDFDDLLILWAKRLKEDPAWCEKLRNAFKFVMVDEFQDNNPLNAEILKRMNPHYMLVVGDGNQSIYGFRNADPSLMEQFKTASPETVVLKLEDNYRSGTKILQLANDIVANSPTPLELRGARGVDGRVEYKSFRSTASEATNTVNWITNLIKKGEKPSEVCVLARSGFSLGVIEMELKYRKIPYKKYGGMTLADTAEVKDFISFLRVVHNPKDQVAWVRALVQFDGMAEAGAMKFIKQHPDGQIPDDAWPSVGKGEFKKVPAMRQWIKDLRSMDKLEDQLSYLVERIHPLMESNYKDNATERMANLRMIAGSAKGSSQTLASFLDAFSTDKLDDGKHPDGAVTLSTIHSAKGLEWKSVWIVGMGSLQMPHSRSTSVAERQEELRLAYVAVTRARDHLVCSYSEKQGNGATQEPCPFLPNERIQWEPESSLGFGDSRQPERRSNVVAW